MTELTAEQRAELRRLGYTEGRQSSWYLLGADGAPGSYLWPYKDHWAAHPSTLQWFESGTEFDDPIAAAIWIKVEIGQ